MKIKEAELLEMKAIVMEDEIYNGTHTDAELVQLKTDLYDLYVYLLNDEEYKKAVKKRTLIKLAGSFVEGALIGCVTYKISKLLNK